MCDSHGFQTQHRAQRERLPRSALPRGDGCAMVPSLPCPAVVLTRDGREVGRIREGGYFGEKALINAAPRGATATGGRAACGSWQQHRLQDCLHKAERSRQPSRLPSCSVCPPSAITRRAPGLCPAPLLQPTATWCATAWAAPPSTSCWAPLRTCGATTRCARQACCEAGAC